MCSSSLVARLLFLLSSLVLLLLPPVDYARAAREMLSSPRRSPLPFRAAAPADTFTPRVLPTLLRTPVLTLRLVSEVVSDQLWQLSAWLRTHGATAACTLFGLALLRAVACQFDGSAGLVHDVERFVAFSIWWLSLGVLSSIGLGSGVHTGMLFLFPHIAKVRREAPLYEQFLITDATARSATLRSSAGTCASTAGPMPGSRWVRESCSRAKAAVAREACQPLVLWLQRCDTAPPRARPSTHLLCTRPFFPACSGA